MLPVLKILDFEIYTYPLIMGIAWALAYQLTEFLNKKLKFPLVNIKLFFILMFLSSWIGAKIFFLATVETSYQNLMSASSFWFGGGFVFYGGMLCGLLVCILYFKVKKIPYSTLNVLIPGLTLGHAIGRFGCFLAGCCYGEVTDFIINVNMHGDLRHPVQLYEATLLLVLFRTFYFKLKRMMVMNQNINNLWTDYLLFYGLIRFCTEILRGDYIRGHVLGGLSTSQLISLLVVCVVLIYKVYAKMNLQKSLH